MGTRLRQFKSPSLASFILPLFVALLWGTQAALAHPVTYEGGTAIQSFNSDKHNEFSVNYTYKHFGSVGFRYLTLEQQHERSHFLIGETHLLAKRWNFEDSQANLIFGAGAGQQSRLSRQEPAYLGSVSGDWESRKIYTKAEYARIARPQSKDLEFKKARLGFSPYLCKFEELNIWLIGEASQMGTLPISYTPFLRFYYRNVLWEIGSTFNEGMQFNLMVHY